MPQIFIYGGSGRFIGGGYKWQGPPKGAVYKFMLFMAQDSEEPMQEIAMLEIGRFGFTDVELLRGRPILVESLNDPKMQAFQKHYAGAFQEGSSLVWYPQV